MSKVFESSAIYKIEYELIKNVKNFRLERGWSQRTLGISETFVGKCEAIDQPEKYNLRHINILKEVFNFESLDDLYPDGLPKDQLIKLRYKKVPKLKVDGTYSKFFETEVIKTIIMNESTKVKSNNS
ncbi:MAG: hypothetical protein ABGW99_00815 [Zunongwangia sp.]|uniref:hypothetical protein n=1 Tax=Zunongwangia sp. TaxID=1965325 RepID=UPI00324239ED